MTAKYLKVERYLSGEDLKKLLKCKHLLLTYTRVNHKPYDIFFYFRKSDRMRK